MMKKQFIVCMSFLGLALLSAPVMSVNQLHNLGNGLVEDLTQTHFYWLQDANIFKTLCDANDPIATGFTPTDAANPAAICSNGGAMSWNDAEGWIARLNSVSYLGRADWRQPQTQQADLSCETQLPESGFIDQGFGYNCRGSELGYLFNTVLGNPNDAGTGSTGGRVGNGCGTNCFINTSPFIHPQGAYWSGDEYAPNTFAAWFFLTETGEQDAGFKNETLFVWPVRSGLRGDCNGNGNVNISDVICTINKVLAGP